MTGFEFGLVPVAIIIGFALTQILIGWGKVVRQWSMLQNPGLFLSFTGFTMAGILSHFVGDWAYRDIELHYGRLVLIILPTLAMVLAIYARSRCVRPPASLLAGTATRMAFPTGAIHPTQTRTVL